MIQSLDPATVEASIARFVEAGVKVSITELDIPSSTGTLTEEDEAKQAELYAKLFVIFKNTQATLNVLRSGARQILKAGVLPEVRYCLIERWLQSLPTMQ